MYSFIHCKLVHTRDLTQDRPKAGNLKLLRVPLSVSSVPGSPSFPSPVVLIGHSWAPLLGFHSKLVWQCCMVFHLWSIPFVWSILPSSPVLLLSKNCPCLRFNGLGEFIVGRYPLATVCMLFEVLWLFFRSWSHEEAQTWGGQAFEVAWTTRLVRMCTVYAYRFLDIASALVVAQQLLQ